jgi:hypothetical protein
MVRHPSKLGPREGMNSAESMGFHREVEGPLVESIVENIHMKRGKIEVRNFGESEATDEPWTFLSGAWLRGWEG